MADTIGPPTTDGTYIVRTKDGLQEYRDMMASVSNGEIRITCSNGFGYWRVAPKDIVAHRPHEPLAVPPAPKRDIGPMPMVRRCFVRWTPNGRIGFGVVANHRVYASLDGGVLQISSAFAITPDEAIAAGVDEGVVREWCGIMGESK